MSLHEYYLTNYTHCHVETGFLATRESLAWTSHSIQAIAFPVQMFAFYLIIMKTPDKMKSVKTPLLIVHSCSTLLDLVLCALVTPFFFLPSTAAFGAGILTERNVNVIHQFLFFLPISNALALSVVNIFETRSRAIPGNPWAVKSRSKRIAILSTQLVLIMSVGLFALQIPSAENQDIFKLKALELHPCPVPEYFTAPTMILLSSKFYGYLFVVHLGTVMFILTLQICFYSICCIYYLYSDKSNVQLSERTRQFQRQFFKAIVLNLTAVFGTLVSAVFLGFTAFFMNWFNQKVFSFVIILLELHGIIEGITVILVHRPYREAAKRIICMREESKSLTFS